MRMCIQRDGGKRACEWSPAGTIRTAIARAVQKEHVVCETQKNPQIIQWVEVTQSYWQTMHKLFESISWPRKSLF